MELELAEQPQQQLQSIAIEFARAGLKDDAIHHDRNERLSVDGWEKCCALRRSGSHHEARYEI